MEIELRDYVVSFISDIDDYDCCHYIHFVSASPINSVGWFDDFYDVIFNSCHDFDSIRILEVNEGF